MPHNDRIATIDRIKYIILEGDPDPQMNGQRTLLGWCRHPRCHIGKSTLQDRLKRTQNGTITRTLRQCIFDPPANGGKISREEIDDVVDTAKQWRIICSLVLRDPLGDLQTREELLEKHAA